MRYEFEVDSIIYIVEYENNEFLFCVNKLKSNIIERDLSFKFGDIPTEREFGLVVTKFPLVVYKKIIKFVKNVVKQKSPYYFTFTANMDVKKTLYEKIARKLANDLNYQLFIKDKIFMFYKLLS